MSATTTQDAKDDHVVVLNGPGGSTATIALFGASVVSFIPEDGIEKLFVSSKSPLTGPKAIRGGIPLVFPCFGPAPKQPPFDKLVQHGFARIQKWNVEKGSDPARAVFTLESNDDIKKIYKPDFKLTYTVALTAGDVLETTFQVYNPSTSSEKLSFQALFHTYFRLPEGTLPSDVTISNSLKGLTYKDKVLHHTADTESRDVFTFSGEVDRVYASYPGSLVAKYGKSEQGLKIETENLPDLVTWNPAEEKSASMADMEQDGWKRFVCLEPGFVENWVDLEPGKSWEAKQKITALSTRLSLPANDASL